MMSWLIDILRTIFLFIDKIIYWFVGEVYSLFLEISQTTLFNEEIFKAFSSKVYALLGIFMLFKVSFSILSYIVNPDEFTDKNKGISKLVKNILISLALLIFVPYIFNEAMDIQRIILKDDIIPKIFSNKDYNISINDVSQGSQISYMVFKEFYTPTNGYVPVDLNDLMSLDVTEKDSNGSYIIDYDMIISSAVGVVLVLILISFCFDIALRSVKLGFLRMVAPVPIIARIDPKKGNDVFNKWVKTCVSTYLDLFVRLIAIFFAIYIIGMLDQITFSSVIDDPNNPIKVGGLTTVFIILGALLFAKQIPKLLEDLLGIKLSGNFQLNPLKNISSKMASVPFAGQLASRTLGAAGSVLAGQGFKSGWKAGGKAVPLMGDDKKFVHSGLSMFTEDGKKNYEAKKKHDLGEKLYKKSLESGEYGIYEGLNANKYAESVKSVNNAKDRRNELQSVYEKLKMNYEANKDNMSAEELQSAIEAVDKARIAAVKAESDYDKVKKAHEYMRSQDIRNAQIEDAFTAAKDSHESLDKVNSFTSNPGYAKNTSFTTSGKTNTTSTPNTNTAQSSSEPSTSPRENIRWNSQTGEFYTPDRYEHDVQQLKYETLFNTYAANEKVDNAERIADTAQRIADANNISKREHAERQAYYDEFFNNEDVKTKVNINERTYDNSNPESHGLDPDSTNNSEW